MTSFLRLIQFEFRRFKGKSKLALIFILVIPLLYGGVYLHANWDLYNNTDKVKIAVVNHDRPASYAGATVDGGAAFEQALKKQGTFDWQFLGTDDDKANEGLRKGDYYMVINVPSNFSKNIVSAGNFKPARASLQLHRDDANGFIIGLLTSQVDNAVGKTLDATVSQTYFDALFVNLGTIKSSLGTASSGAKTLDTNLATATKGVKTMNDSVLGATKSLSGLSAATTKNSDALNNIDTASTKLSTAMTQAQGGVNTISSAAGDLTGDAKKMTSSTAALADKAAKDYPTIKAKAANLVTATGRMQNSGTIQTQTDINASLTSLASLEASHPDLAKDSDYVALRKQLNAAATANTTVTANVNTVVNASAGLNLQLNQSDLDKLAADAKKDAANLNADADKVNKGVQQLNSAMKTADDGVQNIDKGVKQATSAGRDLLAVAPKAIDGVMQLSNALGSLNTAMPQLSNGMHTLATGLDKGNKQIPDLSDRQRTNLADVMSSPVDITQTVDHSAKYYGRGLAPMFLSIAMWIACISTFLVVRTASGRSLTGRANSLKIAMMGFGPLATIGLAGSFLMVAGVWLLLGLDPVHPWLFIGFVTVTSLAWMALAYWIRLILGSPQTAVFLILLVLQLPTCGGTFPVTMLPPFYQKLSVIMPMKYSVDTFRALISGGQMSTVGLGFGVQAGILATSIGLIVWLIRRHKIFRMRDLHPPMVTSTTTADYAFSVRPR